MSETASAINLPFIEAIEFFRQKINLPTKSWLDIQGAAHSHSFSVAGAASESLLNDLRKEVEKAIAEGTTIEEFRKNFDDIVIKRGWDYRGERNWRTRVIFETNLRTAYAAGRYAQMTLPETLESFPFWQYQHSGALHPRLDHLSWDGKTWRANNPIWSKIYPPNGFGCGCFVIPLSQSDLARQGKSGQDVTPNLDQLADGTRGVDQSFEYNPGQAWLSGGRPGESLATAAMIKTFERRALASEIPVNSTVAISTIEDDLLDKLNLPSDTHARLSAATIIDHAKKRPISALEYQTFADQALKSQLYIGPNGGISAIIEKEGLSYVVGFKKTRLGEFLMTTVHRIGARKKAKIESQTLLE